MKRLMLIMITLCSTVFFASAQEIGLQLYSIRNEVKTDLKGSLEKVRKMGIRELEGGELYGMDIMSHKKMLDQMGYKMVSIGVGYKDLDKDLTPIIQKAKTLGATYVVCFAIDHNGNAFGIKDVEEAAAKFNRAGKILKENGLQFCYHPHGFEFRPDGNGTLFDRLVEQTNPLYINYELDVYWAKQGCADPVALLKKYPERFLLMHLKDREHGTTCNDTGHADEETNVVLGKGDVNIKAVMKAAKKTSVKHYFIEDESTRVMAQLPLSLQFLRSLR
jgi:sugar phosphate isomerase/epimerase